MSSKINSLREFGKFRLDAEKKILWCREEPVNLPLKEIELLCVLTENGGEVVTKAELLDKIWIDSFVEEGNLSRHIYILRKTLKDLGETEDLIQTVPRRGYRFKGKLRELPAENRQLIIEKHTNQRTMIEIEETTENKPRILWKSLTRSSFRRNLLIVVSVIIFGGLAATLRDRSFQAKPEIKSIAVLPFKEVNAIAENEQYGLGLTDVLITRLSRLNNLTVRPTSAVAAFENTELDSSQIARQLNVDAVLEGTIYRTSGQLRVTMRLLQTKDEKLLWSGQFEKPSQEEIKMQNEIALGVADALTLNLTGGERELLTKSLTENADALALYQKGRFEWNKRNWQGAVEAERLFRNAIEKDSGFTLAYVGLADTIAMQSDAREAWSVVEKALELDPHSAEAHATLGFLQMFHSWNWQEAESEFKKSIELNPGYATAHHWYGILLEIEGRNEEAKTELERALAINPTSYNFLADLGQIYYKNHEYERAKEYCRKALEIYPEFNFAHDYLYQIYLMTGEFDLAVEESLTAQRFALSYINRSAAEKERIETHLAEQREIYRKNGINAFLKNFLKNSAIDGNNCYFTAAVYSLSGEKQKALDNLEKAWRAQPRFAMPFVKSDPIFDDLRNEPRYQEILRKMNL